jgi:adenylate kinase
MLCCCLRHAPLLRQQDRLMQADCQENGWLLDGFPRTKAQADALAASGVAPDSFIVLDVPDELLVERVVGRRTDPATGKIYHMTYFPPESAEVRQRLVQRGDDTEEKIVVRIAAFKANCAAVEGCYREVLVSLDGTREKGAIFEDISAALDAATAARAAPELAGVQVSTSLYSKQHIHMIVLDDRF